VDDLGTGVDRQSGEGQPPGVAAGVVAVVGANSAGTKRAEQPPERVFRLHGRRTGEGRGVGALGEAEGIVEGEECEETNVGEETSWIEADAIAVEQEDRLIKDQLEHGHERIDELPESKRTCAQEMIIWA
jgi:hypothetical protein